jgi:hypothetical protein
MSEQATRMCIHCRRHVPLSSFKGGSRTRVCLVHARSLRVAYVLGTVRKRAFNCLRLRARHDRFAFGQSCITLSMEELLAFLSDDQIGDYSRWSLVPRHPDRVLSADNAVLVTNYQRRYLMCQWRSGKSIEAYKDHLAFLTAKPEHGPRTPAKPPRGRRGAAATPGVGP